jgi:hypothetical protein
MTMRVKKAESEKLEKWPARIITTTNSNAMMSDAAFGMAMQLSATHLLAKIHAEVKPLLQIQTRRVMTMRVKKAESEKWPALPPTANNNAMMLDAVFGMAMQLSATHLLAKIHAKVKPLLQI